MGFGERVELAEARVEGGRVVHVLDVHELVQKHVAEERLRDEEQVDAARDRAGRRPRRPARAREADPDVRRARDAGLVRERGKDGRDAPRGLAPEVRALAMLAPPMGVFNRPESYARKMADSWAPGLGLLAGAFAPVAAPALGFPKVRGGRLPAGFPAVSLRSPHDWCAEPLGADFPDVSEREVLPPPGTRGGANHRFYWGSPDVAAAVAALAP